ncbi:MAG TPA: S8 family serine peptidase [Pseudonocardiaceae bacterium]|nr:S8 family serine peptidase [Pseudonocardiaceae bacterium]
MPRGLIIALAAATALGGVALAGPTATAAPAPHPDRTVSMPDGSTITVAPDGDARRMSKQGKVIAETMLPVSPGTSALGDSWAPDDAAVRARFDQLATASRSTDVLAVLAGSTSVTGAPMTAGRRAAVTSNGSVNATFAKLSADSVTPLLSGGDAQRLAGAAKARLGDSAVDLSRAVVVHLHGGDATRAAAALRATPGVAFAEPDATVSAMSTDPKPLPAWTGKDAAHPTAGLPDNYGLTSSLQSFLNAGGVNAEGAYSELESRYHQLPGTGEIITNVSIGDLTDQSMADAGDAYVQAYGPTTIVRNGQRYLDLPSMPLIPTYTASPSGTLNPTGSTEEQDPSLGEVMLDFGVMAPLPHDQQRTGAVGSGDTDLLGIAPGAQYRLVVPQDPTVDEIPAALLAAARQTPRPDVITASLGFGTDVDGFPGRYLEDDPIEQAVIAAIVQEYHIVVCISANDGTRLYTPAAVGPDGGSTPTDVTSDPRAVTNIDDDANSTTPTEVRDSGAIAVGGTTLDDTLAVPGGHNPTYAASRTDGSGEFSSGFGSRIDVSAPSDGIPAFEHPQGGAPQDVLAVNTGGTSASAPMTAAAAAVVLQAARLTGQHVTPEAVRTLLERTGHAVATPPQADQQLNVGPRIDVTAAVDSVLGRRAGGTRIARVSVAHRQTIGALGGTFTEVTDPTTIDLAGPSSTGEGLVGPVTIAADVTSLPTGHPTYVLTVGRKEFTSTTPAIRLTPTELLTAAGQPVVSSTARTISYTFQVRQGRQVLASAQRQLTFGPTDGTYAEALAPHAPATVRAGSPVTVSYDLTGARDVVSPEIVVSTVGHWNPATAPIFSPAYTAPLTGTSGTVTIPASAFDGGGGIYGIGIIQDSTNAAALRPVYGEFTSIRVDGGTAAARAGAPTLSAGGAFGHDLEVGRTQQFSMDYDVRNVPGAVGAAVEVSAPAPTLFNALNTVTNANGTVRDDDGVDSGSVAYQRLPGRSGVARLSAAALGIGGSLSYNVRVFALDRAGHVVGQASPTSMLTVDDGVAPGWVGSFAAAGDQSVVAVRDASGGESLRTYRTDTGAYGAVLASDASSDDGYDVIGVDQAAHRVLALHWQGGAVSLETYDTAGGRVASVSESAYSVLGGRVDPARHRAEVLAHRASDNADVVLSVDLGSGAVTALPADAPGIAAGHYGLVDVDQGSGAAVLAKAGGGLICFGGGGAGLLADVDPGSGAITPGTSGDGCSSRIAVDQGSHSVYQMSYRSFSLNIAGTTNLIPSTGSPLVEGSAIAVRQQPALGFAVDSVHHLALVAFQTPMGKPQFGSINGVISDNNAMSQIAVVDLTTGKTVSVLGGFDFATGYFLGEYNGNTEQSIQVDPATRTGWTYSPDGTQVQRFSY